MKVSWSICRKRLALLWFIGAGVIFFLFVFMTFGKRFGEHADVAWGWFLPTIIPTLSLITGVFVVDVLGKGNKIRNVDRFYYRLSFSLSFTYLFVVLITLLVRPFTVYNPIEILQVSNLWLGPFQGIVNASLGAFFIRKAQD